MGMDRRNFLKVAGLSTLMAAGGKAAVDVLAPGDLEASMKSTPLTKGKRWAMVIDMRYMDDEIMDACVAACHREHNVPDVGNTKDEIKWIWKEQYEHIFPGQQHDYASEEYKGKFFLITCNHCTNPPCCRVCPTRATWQRSDGVVMMDMHRCIGCRFCMAACPFGARSFNFGDPRKAPEDLNPDFPTNPAYPTRSKGVVEKCTFCAERIAKGMMPACVEAADKIKEDVLIFGDLSNPDSRVREALRANYSIRRKPELGTEPNVFYIV
jgi:molybdopterin-containing oxidoreductase family iron-sulfur binding subunit